MKKMHCQIQNHNNKKIITVCMDKQCKNQRLCCVICMNENHSAHPTKFIELDELNEFIEQESNKKVSYPESCTPGQKQIIDGLEQLSTQIDTLQKKIREEIEMIKQQNMQEHLKKNYTKHEGIQNWNQFLKDILQYVEIQNCQLTKATFQEGQLNQFEAQLIKIIQKSEESLQVIFNSLNNPQIYIGELCFKENRKHPDITIIDNSTIKKTNTGSYSMAFSDEGFDPGYQSYQFAFNIQIKCQWVMIGVGNDEANKVPSYTLSWNPNLGHGQYLISYNNWTYHHTNGEFQYKQKGMNFKVGDKIQIRYDHLTKILEFRKGSDQTIVKMPITDMSQKLYPCALLHYPDDQVQLVEY